MQEIIHIKTVAEAHHIMGLAPPKHPLISVYYDQKTCFPKEYEGQKLSSDFYIIMFKDRSNGSIGYGRNDYDYEEGTLVFIAPHQVLTVPPQGVVQQSKGWSLIFHPNLIQKSHLAEAMDEYSFFAYETSEALHLSETEQGHIASVVRQIENEYSQNLDRHSQRLIVSNLELLLNYCTRFYDRQFYTRTNFNKGFIAQFEHLLKAYFNTEKIEVMGLPAVGYFAQKMNMSANYLSDLLKKETGKSAKAHINEFIISKAKVKLLNSTASISEIAYDLGFEYPQSLSRLFKSKTGMSPNEYRSLN